MDKQAAIEAVQDTAQKAHDAAAQHGQDSPQAKTAADRTGLAIRLAVQLARRN
jgi:hypothetical protein